MSVVNKTKKTRVAEKYRLCRSIASKAKGLMFTTESTVIEKALIFEFNTPSSQSIHMFFVFYPIDIVFLDENKKVVDMVEGLKPFLIYNSRRPSKYVVELPRSAIRKSKTSRGDVWKW
jgi:uncharacterized membrane protein (UPF0127 family)